VIQPRGSSAANRHAHGQFIDPGTAMANTRFDPCPSAEALRRIAGARWTPYVAATLQTWCRRALTEPAACANSRAENCAACGALHKIAALHWSDALGERIQQIAREVAGKADLRKAGDPVLNCASF
jgi:hypothetical protein